MNRVKYPELASEMAKRGEKQKVLAKLLDVTPACISRKLAGKTEWTISEVEKLCKYYNKDFYELFKQNN